MTQQEAWPGIVWSQSGLASFQVRGGQCIPCLLLPYINNVKTSLQKGQDRSLPPRTGRFLCFQIWTACVKSGNIEIARVH